MAGSGNRIVGRWWLHLAVPCVLVALVVVLAILQYRWVGQIADAERQRMQTSAQARANQFADEIDRELTTLFFSLSQLTGQSPSGDAAPHVMGPPPDGDSAAVFAADYARWAATSAHPKLVRALYLWETDGPTPSLRKLAPGDAAFQAADWPSELAAVRATLEGGADKAASLAPQFDARIPGLVLPVARYKTSDVPTDTPGRIRIFNMVGLRGHLVVVLDRDYIRREWLPALAHRYFGTGDGFDYNVAVRDSSSRAFVYVSDSGLGPTAFGRPDVTAALFRIRTDQFERFVIGRGTPKAGTVNRMFQLSVSALREHATGPAPVRPAEAPAQWELVLAHRAGSLEAAIAQSRHRNLAISFGILALLAVSLALVVISTRRATSLAEQQVEFVAGVSHELRTPLSVICSAAENLADGVVLGPTAVRRYGGLIADEGRRLADMVEQVMAFAGFHAGREIGERRKVAVADVVEQALAGSARTIERQHVKLETAVAGGLPPVTVNPRAIERALHNLIDNAVKYGGESRWIRVSADWDASARRVAITVHDRGVGIAPEEQRRIFEPFFRGRDMAASPIHGSGLGLSLVRRIVEAHGGTVAVKSAKGEGSAFTILLPVERAATASASETGVQEPAR